MASGEEDGGAGVDKDMMQALEKLSALVSADLDAPETRGKIKQVANELGIFITFALCVSISFSVACLLPLAFGLRLGAFRRLLVAFAFAFAIAIQVQVQVAIRWLLQLAVKVAVAVCPSRSVASSTLRGGAAPTSVAVTRPTPYELWTSAHMVAASRRKKVKVMTNRQWAGVVQRLNDTTRQRHARMLKEQSATIGEEMANLSFAPSICQKSREYAQSVQPLHVRLSELQKKKKEKLDKQRSEISQKLMNRVTFQPMLDTPCICSVGIGLLASQELGILDDHTPACLKFMRACAASNAMTQTSRPRTQRTVDHLTQYDEYKRIRAEQRRQIMEEVENRELTFQPQINANSSAMAKRFKAKQRRREAEKAAAKRRLQQLKKAGVRVRPSNKDVGHEQETFTPRINKRSKRAPGKGGDIYQRLYDEGAARHLSRHLRTAAANAEARGEVRRAQKLLDMANSPMQVVKRSTDADSVDTAMLNWSPGSDTALARSPRRTAALVTSKAAFNTVVFDIDKHSFILSRLQRQAQTVVDRARPANPDPFA